MRNQSTSFARGAQKWQRHALAQACFMVAAGISTTALAVDFTPGAVLSTTNAELGDGGAADATQTSRAYWSTGYNTQIVNDQLGSGQIDGVMSTNSLFSTLTGAGSTPVSLNGNDLMLYSYGNQNSNANLALGTLSRVSSSNDGQLALNLQIFSGLAVDGVGADTFAKQSVLATATDTSLYIEQTGKTAAALSLSSNNVGATLSLNTVSTTVTGATPSAYVSDTKGSSSVTYGDNNNTGSVAVSAPSSTRGTTGSVNLSNLQSAFNAEGTAQLDTPRINITVAETTGSLSEGVSVNANTLSANNTSNEASSVFQATSASSAFTGSVAVTNIQATLTDASLTTTQLSNVKDSALGADLRNTNGETTVTGSVSVNGNTVSAQSLGNTAGARTSTGSIAVGNAIIFEGSANITGPTAPSALNTAAAVHTAEINSTSTLGKADLLINSVQRNAGNAFTSTVDNGSITTKADNLDGGVLAQNSNIQSTTATANLAGNLIQAGANASVANLSANAAVINTQVNNTVGATASVVDLTQQVTVGIAGSADVITGTVSLNDNRILATAEGNAAASQISLKASNLSVGGNGNGLVSLIPTEAAVASSGLAASVLSAQANDSLTLTSNNNGNTVAAKFNDQDVVATDLAITGSQVSVNGNTLQSSAIANAASNSNILVADTATGLNAGLGNSQRNTSVAVTANAGFGTDVTVAIGVADVTGSSLSMNTNTLNATAKGNSTSNNLSVTATNASGLAAVTGGLFAATAPYAQAADAGSSTGVQANADFALANAQTDSGGTLQSVLSGSTQINTTTVDSSTITATGNNLTASTSVNSAGNALNLAITNMTGMSAGLSSSQNVATGTVSADATAQVAIGTGSPAASNVLNGSSLSLNTNTISASVSANTVQNALTLTATTASGRDLSNDEGENLATTTLQAGLANATADMALANQQKITSSTFEATTEAGITLSAGNITGSSVTVNANSTSASVSANRGTNSIALAVNNLTQPNTGLASFQSSSASTFTAQVDDASVTLGTGFVGGDTDNAQIAVTSNQIKASVLGNVVSNAISISGSQATGSPLPMADNTATVNPGTEIITSASAGLANWQLSNADTFSANVGGIGSTPKIVLTAGDAINATALSLSSNSLASSTYAIDASNTLALSSTQSSGMTGTLASGQSVIDANVSATTLGQVALTATDASGASTASVNSNSISATLSVNNVSSTLQVRGDQFTGQNTLVPAFTTESNSDSGSNVVTALSDLNLVNVQKISGYLADGAKASVTGDVLTTFNSLDNASVSSNSNAVTAYASANSANNLADVQTTGFNAASLGVASAQYAVSVPVIATALGQVITQGDSASATVNGASVAVNSNTIRSTAASNIVDNTLILKASNASGAAVTLSSAAQVAEGTASAAADWAVVNNQTTANENVEARTGSVGTNALVKLLLDGNTTLDVTDGASALSLNSNSLSANAYGNSATNAATVALTQASGMKGALANNQWLSTGSNVIAETLGAVEANIQGITGSSLSVNSNAITATAMGNTVGNTMAVSGAAASGRSQAPSIILSSTNALSADYALINQQTVYNDSEPSANNDSEVRIYSGNITSSTVSQNSNSISSYASANQANNVMSLAVTELSAATAGLASVQTAVGSVSDVAAQTVAGVFNYGGNATGANISLNSNQIKSSVYNNLAVNQINVAGSGAQSGGTSVNSTALNLSSTSADVSVLNSQTSKYSMGANASTNGLAEVALGSIGSNSTVSVDNNRISSQGYLSSASNGVAINVTNLTAMNANVLNSQSATSGAQLFLNTDGTVQITATGSVSDASLSLSGNTTSATASGNAADNTLLVQSTTASGRGVGSRESLASSALAVKADYAVGNYQVGTSSSTVEAGTVAEALLFADTNTATDSQLTMASNSLTAYASGNSANNQLTLAMNQLTQASAAVSSYQSGATGSSTVGDFDGRVKLTVGALDTVSLSVKDNSIKATAIGNVVENTLQVTANTVTGTGTGSVTAQATDTSATASADFAITNAQSLASGANVSSNTVGSINVETGAGSVTDSSLSLTGNSVKSLAVANSASNTLVLNVAQQNGLAAGTSNGLTAAVSSSQTSAITVTANTEPKSTSLFGIQTAGVTDSTITVSDNTASAVASKNEAFNTLTVSGANLFGRGGDVSSSVAGTSSVTGADFAVINAQSASGITTATMDAGSSGLDSGVISGSTITLSGNSILANASANTAGNSLSLSASNLLEASGVVNNVQSLAASASVTSSVASGSALSVETAVGAGSANVAVTGNLVKSTASANVATNALNATSSSGTAGAGAVSSPSGSNTATPTFAVLNSQSTGAGSTVTSTVYGFNMGGAQLNGALNSGGSATVTGNTIQSLAYGNSASNAIQVSALTPGLNTASTAITNVQYNLASVTATVSNVAIKGSGLNSTGAANVNIGGNSIVAMAVGNRAVNTVTGR